MWHNHAKGARLKMSAQSGNTRRLSAACIKKGFILVALAAVLLLVASAPRAQNAVQPQGEKGETAPSGNAENGKKIFTKDGCYECHGREGQGAAQGAGPRIGPLQLSFEAFTKYVHQPTGQMPPYTSKVISDQELADIYAFLQSRPKATPSKDIPLLNQ
jgi:mono/diheme cytochrome c family protein